MSSAPSRPYHPIVANNDDNRDHDRRPFAMPQPHRASSYHNIRQPYLTNVKIELPASPDLVFPPHRAQSALGHSSTESFLPRASTSGLGSHPSSFPSTPFNFMADYTWPPPSSTPSTAQGNPQPSYSLMSSNPPSQSLYGLSSAAGAYAHDDEYDDDGDLTDMNVVQSLGGEGGKRDDRMIRKRSSKACDQCRKSKCKCERTNPSDPCKNCIMLNTACTFLGPSRKRGPPKGYIDAIEARLHQTEALLGIFLASRDPRALSLLDDVSDDPLAKEIINRVDESPYGVRGRQRGAEAPAKRNPPRSGDQPLATTHPSNEWQDKIVSRLREVARGRSEGRTDARSMSVDTRALESRPLSAASNSPTRSQRQVRRRLDDPGATTLLPAYQPPAAGGALASKPSTSSLSHEYRSASAGSPSSLSVAVADESDDDDADAVAEAIGQLSLNEYQHLRYHGAASGLHLLGTRPRVDTRHDDGVWRFPKGMWPAPSSKVAGSGFMASTELEQELLRDLPPAAEQEHLLELYWTYVHPALPIIHKEMFMEAFRARLIGGLSTRPSEDTSVSGTRLRPIPLQLLLTMFSVAVRYAAHAPEPLPSKGELWTAGEKYFFSAKSLLHRTFAISHPATVQTFLLMGYREIGVGAMAQAWQCIGAAIRTAQDLGMHKKADGWAMRERAVFTPRELHERSRIWYACVVLDKHISAYVGRPVSVTERDWDVSLPGVDHPEETEEWKPHQSRPTAATEDGHNDEGRAPVVGRVLSCFNHSATLSAILSRVLETMYAVRPISGRHAVLAQLEQALDKWYLELPDALRFDPNPRTPNKESVPPPHVLTLHMQYWTTVLLLHRPFTQRAKRVAILEGTPSPDARAVGRKSFDICTQAANRVTSIMSVFLQNWCVARAPVFLCYYVFTAATMHFHILATFPNDPQARVGLSTCVNALKGMEVVWPSAGRARDLLEGAHIEPADPALASQPASAVQGPSRKRSLDAEEHEPFAYTATDGEPTGRQSRASDYGTPASTSAVQTQHVLPPPPGPPAGAGNAPFGSYSQQHSPPSFERYWSATGASSIGSTLSTSVLPQQYSTGLIDPDRGMYDAVAGTIEGDRTYLANGGRYPPQYWHDYSTLGQMGMTGAMMDRPPAQQQPPPPHPSGPKQGQSQQPYYLPQHYSSFSMSPLLS